MSPLPRQDEHETLETFFENVDLSLAERLVHRCFHTRGPEDQKSKYHKQPAVESAYSFLKTR